MSDVSLDYLVSGGQERFRNGEAERLRRLEVDDEFELTRLHDRQIGWFLAFENASGVDASLVESIAEAAASRVGSRRGSGFE
jgi:hypothetical protein